ncbi:uncharacterized protein PFL1_01822 [Pseudozyma flocculosa PF-1]|uniref:uncharacterized protein n=1 Tax=Pseudozyma flocculosa PF-1 TaxID=1277687 RepID=UPI000456092E|nr:uncharacterized protein PFL1_01822 [Pseudozyma flocculosa PF-1]EPQ30924.1 hypothetical protein PFL1_01822 [Pseudozyma flocculosa PF-1]
MGLIQGNDVWVGQYSHTTKGENRVAAAIREQRLREEENKASSSQPEPQQQDGKNTEGFLDKIKQKFLLGRGSAT